eukprot:1563742-Alexandrium_andersonii.AAC.1
MRCPRASPAGEVPGAAWCSACAPAGWEVVGGWPALLARIPVAGRVPLAARRWPTQHPVDVPHHELPQQPPAEDVCPL